MGSKLLKGMFLGGIVAYVWMMVSWMLIPWHFWTMNEFKNEEAVTQSLMANTEKDGVYVLPYFGDQDVTEIDGVAKEGSRGTFAFVSIKREGHDLKFGAFFSSLITQFVGALIISYFICHMVGLGYWKGVWIATLAGFLVGALGEFPNWTWWQFPAGFVWLEIVDLTIGWFLAGLVISGVARRKA